MALTRRIGVKELFRCDPVGQAPEFFRRGGPESCFNPAVSVDPESEHLLVPRFAQRGHDTALRSPVLFILTNLDETIADQGAQSVSQR